MNFPNSNYHENKGRVLYKRYDKQMGHYCSSHETGLALALYSLSIKHYVKLLLSTF